MRTTQIIAIASLLLPLTLAAQVPPDKSAQLITREVAQPLGEARVALIMGVAEVGSPMFSSLPGIKQDLAKMKAALEAAKFEVTVVSEPTLSEAHKAIDAFGDRLLATKGVGLFYFSGHGGEFNGTNYLMPKGARISRPVDVQQEAISAKRIISRMEGQGTRVNIIFLDCCRNDLTKAASDSGLAVMQAEGTFIGFATASEKTAAASSDGSPYTSVLCKHLTEPGQSISDMHTRVTAEVKAITRAAGAPQTPFMNSGLSDLFYFVPGNSAPIPTAPGGGLTPVAALPVDVIVRAFPLGGDVEMKFVFIKPGSYYLGSPVNEPGRDKNDEFGGHVRISREFWMAQTECTQAQWQVVMGGNPSEFRGPDLPVETVGWADAMKFCELMEKRVKPKDGWHVTLPTEAQWEFACRAGKQSAFSFGPDLGDLCHHANYADKSFTQFPDMADKEHSDGVGDSTAPVASYKPNAWGLYDMHGNVWEWCLHSYQLAQPVGADPISNPGGRQRAMRGGSWFTSWQSCRSASRSPGGTDIKRNSIGFRVVLAK